MRNSNQFLSIALGVALAIPVGASGQQTSPPTSTTPPTTPPTISQLQLPFTLKKLDGDLTTYEVISYTGKDEWLWPGDKVLGVGNAAESDVPIVFAQQDLEPREFTYLLGGTDMYYRARSLRELEGIIRDRLDRNGRVSFLVRDSTNQYRVVSLRCEGAFVPEAPVIAPAR